MGDRTHVIVTHLTKDLPAFEEIMGSGWETTEDNSPEQGFITGEGSEFNYGGEVYWQELAKMGISFYGEHGSGGEYGEYIFASDGREYQCMPSSNSDAIIPVPDVEGHESDCDKAFRMVKKFYAFRTKVKKQMKLQLAKENDFDFIQEIEDGLREIGYRIYESLEGLKPGMYIALFHGTRTDEQRELCGEAGRRGANGPVFGPLSFCHGTYSTHLVCKYVKPWGGRPSKLPDDVDSFDDDSIELKFKNDCVLFGGITYGDFTVFYWDGEKVVGS